jgi:hypothetical protein
VQHEKDIGDDNKRIRGTSEKKKVKVYAAGEIRERTIGWIIKQRREFNRQRNLKKR